MDSSILVNIDFDCESIISGDNFFCLNGDIFYFI